MIIRVYGVVHLCACVRARVFAGNQVQTRIFLSVILGKSVLTTPVCLSTALPQHAKKLQHFTVWFINTRTSWLAEYFSHPSSSSGVKKPKLPTHTELHTPTQLSELAVKPCTLLLLTVTLPSSDVSLAAIFRTPHPSPLAIHTHPLPFRSPNTSKV